LLLILYRLFVNLRSFVNKLAGLRLLLNGIRLLVRLLLDLLVLFSRAQTGLFMLGTHDGVSVLQQDESVFQLAYVIFLSRQFARHSPDRFTQLVVGEARVRRLNTVGLTERRAVWSCRQASVVAGW